MFKKILIANRGEIAVRIIRTCRDLGLATLALYQRPDLGSLHVRLADEAVELTSPAGFGDAAAIVAIARHAGADAVHPGYGFLAEQADFNAACRAAGLAFVGPPPEVVAILRDKIVALNAARAYGYPTMPYSPRPFGESDLEAVRAEAERLGYPVVVKSLIGGRGRGERLVRGPDRLAEAVQRAQAEAHAVYGDKRVYLEKAILPAHQIGVQVLADAHGAVIHLGEHEGSIIYGNQKIVEEAPAPCLTAEGRARLCQAAVELARLFDYRNAGTVEFLVDAAGQYFFTEIKARIQIEHPVTEMVTRLDLVREQLRLAAGEPLGRTQAEVAGRGHAILCRVNAEDPSQRFLPTPGLLRRVRLPGGPEVRVDTYAYSGCQVPAEYDPIVAKVTVWAEDRPACLGRLRRALEDFTLIGTPTTLPLLQHLLDHPDFLQGCYTTELLAQALEEAAPPPAAHRRDLAVAAAVAYVLRHQAIQPATPDRLRSGWHRASRQLPR
jgi:acetyl/propionyl-CoA carboxylase alpha subunit